jgi:putative glutamine amidotransferase
MKILIVGGSRGYTKPFTQLGEVILEDSKFIANPSSFDLLVFTGGEDVCPAMYGQSSPKHLCSYNLKRDIYEQKLYELAISNNIKMTGICRGSQFLNAMSGGTIMHHIENHGTDHIIETIDGNIIEVTSTHHQMCIPGKKGYIMAWSSSKRSEVYYGDKDKQINYTGKEVESIYYPENNIFAVQFHPEYMNTTSKGFLWYREAVYNLLHMTEKEFKNKYLNKKLESVV